jgi:AcrR family transcriptional regulator
MKRLSGAARRAQIVGTAAALFARAGFGGSTRDLARDLGLSQAALYKHFPSKGALIDAVFDAAFDPAPRAESARALAVRRGPLAERLIAFYRARLAESDPVRLRLWMRANLDGLAFAKRYTPTLDRHTLIPVLNALRADLRLPALTGAPAAEEREIAMQLHAAIVFAQIRRDVYATPLDADAMRALVRAYVEIWLPGARAKMRRLQQGD